MSLVERTVTTREMRALELNAEYLGVSIFQMMENAGKAVANEIASRFKPKSKVVIFGGVGRNGGDGMVAARHLASMGFNVEFSLIGKESELRDENVIRNWQTLRKISWSIVTNEVYDSSLISVPECDVAVCGLVGTGAKGKLRQPILQAVKALNKAECFKVAVDLPNGIDADNGEVLGEAVKADLTVTFHRMKKGLEKAREYAGEIKVADIGIPPEAELYAGPGDVEKVRKPRPPESHKGDFGRLLVIGGSETYSGAPAYVALAALRSGVDLTYICAPEKTAYAISSMSPDLITIKLKGQHFAPENLDEIKPFLERATGVAVGPGLGMHKDTVNAVEKLLDFLGKLNKPTLFDADAIKAFGLRKRRVSFPFVLTPHAGEFEALSGKSLPADLKQKMDKVKSVAREIGATILLKGPVDIVSNGDNVKLNFTHNPGMTVGGTGDVLSGIVGAFLAQGFYIFEASVAGAFLNGLAGNLVFKEKGYHMVATDLIEKIPSAIMNSTSR